MVLKWFIDADMTDDIDRARFYWSIWSPLQGELYHEILSYKSVLL